MRRPLIAGNWKMNLDLAAARALVRALRSGLTLDQTERGEVAVCVPFVHLFPLADDLRGSAIALGAQNLYFETSGAFTGEISGTMIAETGAKYVLVGHSERRHTIGHHEDDRMVNLKLRAAGRAGLTPILCVGETLDERKAEQTPDVLAFQLWAGLHGVDLRSPEQLVVAYEPVWAIGTGHHATPEQAQEAHAHLRATLRKIAGPAADKIRILYGGSVKPDNAAAIVGQADVDGALVGGASLTAESFLGIFRAALAARGML